MPKIQFEGRPIQCREGESILDCLLRHGERIPYGCRAGACQSCLVQSLNDTHMPGCQQGLSEFQRRQGMVLACQCVSAPSLQLRRVSDELSRRAATVIDKTLLTPHVLRLRLRSAISWQAGQYLNLWLDGLSQTRSYSIASVAQLDPWLELHVRLYPNGYLSSRLRENVQIGDQIQIQGPLGELYQTPSESASNILFLAEGTGLAPLLGVARQTQLDGDNGRTHLFYISSDPEAHYGKTALAALQCELPAMRYTLLSSGGTSAANRYQALETSLAEQFTTLRDHRIYISGSSAFVDTLQRRCFLRGAARKDIHTERFLDFNNAAPP